MTAEAKSSGGVGKLYLLLSVLACFGLGAIALYSSGVGLVEPKFHRAAGFALALVVGITASRARREADRSVTGPRATMHFFLDAAMLAAGLGVRSVTRTTAPFDLSKPPLMVQAGE